MAPRDSRERDPLLEAITTEGDCSLLRGEQLSLRQLGNPREVRMPSAARMPLERSGQPSVGGVRPPGVP